MILSNRHALRRAVRIGAIVTIVISFTLLLNPASPTYGDSYNLVQSDDPQVIRIGDWAAIDAPEASGGTYICNTSQSAALQIQFIGPAVEIFFVGGPGYAPLAIEIDGTVLRTVLTESSETEYGRSAMISYLTDAPHRLKVYASKDGVVAIDAFQIILSRLSPPAAPSNVSAYDYDWNETGTVAQLNWQDNSDNEYGFDVFVARYSLYAWWDWESLTVTGADVTSLEVVVPDGEVWCFTVMSFRHGIGRTVYSEYSYIACVAGFDWIWFD